MNQPLDLQPLDPEPKWCFDYYVSMMRQLWIPGIFTGEPRLIEMACRAQGWHPPSKKEVCTITEGEATYEIRRVK